MVTNIKRKLIGEELFCTKAGCCIVKLAYNHYVYNVDVSVITMQQFLERKTLHCLTLKVHLFIQHVTIQLYGETGSVLGMRFDINNMITLFHNIISSRASSQQFKYNHWM